MAMSYTIQQYFDPQIPVIVTISTLWILSQFFDIEHKL